MTRGGAVGVAPFLLLLLRRREEQKNLCGGESETKKVKKGEYRKIKRNFHTQRAPTMGRILTQSNIRV